MPKTALLTSFAPWKAHHGTNSADDLLIELAQLTKETEETSSSLHFLRQLPVNFPVAQSIAVYKIKQLQPDMILCCGMAEFRQKLSLESSAVCNDRRLYTNVDLESLTTELKLTEISHDAGRFVCNALYYGILNYLKCYSPDTLCLFVHVPVLTPNNRKHILTDFWSILEKLEILEQLKT